MILLTLSNLYKQKKKKSGSCQGKTAGKIGGKFNRYKVTVIKMNKF